MGGKKDAERRTQASSGHQTCQYRFKLENDRLTFILNQPKVVGVMHFLEHIWCGFGRIFLKPSG